jgi:hypothetical protein
MVFYFLHSQPDPSAEYSGKKGVKVGMEGVGNIPISVTEYRKKMWGLGNHEREEMEMGMEME